MKAILVMDMPSSCMECTLCKNMSDNCNYCMATNKIIVDVESKTHCCPLRLMPSKKSNAIGTNYQRFVKGYNACIDEILGDKE